MNETLREILKYGKKNPGWCSAALIGLGRAILYSFQVGYAYYFNVGIRRIDIINGNVVFQLLLYAVLAGLLLFFYQLGYTYYKKGKLLVYLGGFAALFFILCAAFVMKTAQELPTLSEFIYVSLEMLLMSVVVTAVFNFMAISHVLCPSLKDKIEITEMKLKRIKNPKKKKRMQIKLCELTNMQNTMDSQGKPDNFADKSVSFKIVFCAGMISLCFIAFLCFGYVSASSKKDFKTISNKYIILENGAYRDGFAVVFEENNGYVVAPYQYADDQINLYIREQIIVEEKNIFTVEKSFPKVNCIIEN